MEKGKQVMVVGGNRPTNAEKIALLQALGGKILHTKAQKANIQIICERPAGMSMEEYKMLRRKQTKAIKNVLR